MKLIAIAATAAILTGCAGAANKTTGAFYTDAKYGETATSASSAKKMGKACQSSILGVVATGDASIDAAKQNGGISKVSSVDAEVSSILGIIAEYCTVVRGS